MALLDSPIHGGAGSRSQYVFIAGEPVLLAVGVSNVGGTSLRLNIQNFTPDDLATFVLQRKNGDAWLPVPFRLSPAGKPRITRAGQTVPHPSGNGLELFDGSLELPLEIVFTADAVPGIYRLEVKDIGLTCEPDCQVRDHAGLFRFEVRDGSEVDARAELLTRRAWIALMVDSRLKEAEAPIAELLRIHPRSVWGHQLRGQIAEARKQWDLAAREYDTALQILLRGEDTLYAEARPEAVQDRIADLRAMRDAMKARK